MVGDWALVAAGAAVGAPLRFLTDRLVQRWHPSVMPWGTLAVNVVGSAVFGLVAGGVVHHAVGTRALLLLGVGFCGTLTTFSSFAFETDRLAEDGAVALAAGNVVVTVVAALLAAAGGWWLASALWA